MSANTPSLEQKPRRIQRRRVKGWKMPPNTVYVGRPTKWGNPRRLGELQGYSRADAVTDYRRWLNRDPATWSYAYGRTVPTAAEIRSELRGKNLSCFCPLNQPCHADVLLEIANAD